MPSAGERPLGLTFWAKKVRRVAGRNPLVRLLDKRARTRHGPPLTAHGLRTTAHGSRITREIGEASHKTQDNQLVTTDFATPNPLTGRPLLSGPIWAFCHATCLLGVSPYAAHFLKEVRVSFYQLEQLD